MKLLVTIDHQTFERQVDPKKGLQEARDIVASGLETETEDGCLEIRPPHRIQLVTVVAEEGDKPKKKPAK